jgi:hypothetical protein
MTGCSAGMEFITCEGIPGVCAIGESQVNAQAQDALPGEDFCLDCQSTGRDWHPFFIRSSLDCY